MNNSFITSVFLKQFDAKSVTYLTFFYVHLPFFSRDVYSFS
uniref:Uncharacterized protein MANES_12G114000 n=1 Tax=Rhizophora mucronata TaxID=61149 RepID=A0A2P2KEA9_RHIMU